MTIAHQALLRWGKLWEIPVAHVPLEFNPPGSSAFQLESAVVVGGSGDRTSTMWEEGGVRSCVSLHMSFSIFPNQRPQLYQVSLQPGHGQFPAVACSAVVSHPCQLPSCAHTFAKGPFITTLLNHPFSGAPAAARTLPDNVSIRIQHEGNLGPQASF